MIFPDFCLEGSALYGHAGGVRRRLRCAGSRDELHRHETEQRRHDGLEPIRDSQSRRSRHFEPFLMIYDSLRQAPGRRRKFAP